MNSQNEEGNTIFTVDHDGNVLCHDCGEKGVKEGRLDDLATGYNVHWEGKNLVCSDCSFVLEPVYKVLK